MNNRRNELIIASAKKYCKCTVQGKTIRVNQLFENGNFEDTSSWIPQYGTFNVSNNVGTLTCSGTNPNARLEQYATLTANHKYLICSYMRCNHTRNGVCDVGGASGSSFILNANEWKLVIQFATANVSGNRTCMLQLYDAQSGDTLDYKNYMLIDLTELGLDNISSVAEFYQTDIGKLVEKGVYFETTPTNVFMHSNTPINFIGRNIWDEQMELGSLTNGAEVSSSTELRNVGYIKVYPNTQYFGYRKDGTTIFLSFYDIDENFIEEGAINNDSFTTPNNCAYLRFRLTSSYGTTYNHDICISENLFNYKTLNKDFYIDNNGDLASETNSYTSDLIKVNGGTTIACNMYLSQVCAYDKNKNFLFFLNNGSDFEENQSIILPPNCEYIRVSRRYGLIFTDGTTIFYIGYEPYCGVSTFRRGFRLIKGDTYKSWTLNEIEYNNILEEGDFPSSNSWANNGLSSSFSNSVMTLTTTSNYQSVYHECEKTSGHKYIFLVYAKNVSGITSFAFGWHSSTSTDINITSNWELYGYLVPQISGSSPYAYIYPRGVGTAQFKNYMIIDLTELGLDNITSVQEFLNTPLYAYIQKYGYLPYTTTNETTKEQLVRTMALVDLENDLTWYVYTNYQLPNKVVWYSDEYIQDDFNVKIPIDRYNLPNGLNEKGRIITYDDLFKGNCEVGDIAIDSDGTVYGVTSSDQVEPTGHLLLELTTPQNITSYNVISGGHPIFVDVVSQLVARNTIKVESANGIELDFTKE